MRSIYPINHGALGVEMREATRTRSIVITAIIIMAIMVIMVITVIVIIWAIWESMQMISI